MILRFSSTIEQVLAASETLRLVVRPIAGIQILEVDRATLLSHADGLALSPCELRPGSRVAISGDDDGSPCLRVRELVLDPNSLVREWAG